MLNSLKIGVFIVVVLSLLQVKACDNCNVFLSINPNDYQNSISLTYRSRYHIGTYNQFGLINPKHGGTEPTYQNQQVEEYYRRLEVSGEYYWNPKWRAQLVLPFVSNVQSFNGLAKYLVNGVGDPLLIQNYQVFSTKDLNDSLSFNQRLEIGAGVKIPMGSISRTYLNGVPNIDLQTGTGSWDGILTTTYLAKFKKIGWSTQVNYKLNSKNKEQFKYGNTLNFQSSIFYMKTFSKLTFMPSLGVYSEIFQNEFFQNIESINSNGSIWFADIGVNVFIRKLRVTGNYQPVFTSILKDPSAIPAKSRFAIGINYTF